MPSNLVSNSGGSINEGTSEVAVNIGEQGEGLVLVLSLDHSALGSGLRREGRVEGHLQTFENLVLESKYKSG